MKNLIIGAIKIYQFFLSSDHGLCRRSGRGCRFWPSCSVYASQAINKYGIFAGTLKSIRRIFRCHPFSPGGYEPLD